MSAPSEIVQLALICFTTPFVCLCIMYCYLIYNNRVANTTGEVRYTLPSEMMLRILAVFLVAIITFILTFQKIMDVSVASAILSSIVTGVIASYNGEKK